MTEQTMTALAEVDILPAPEAVNEFKPPAVSGAEEIRFDKTATQVVPIVFVEDGERYEVTHTFGALTDEALQEFDELRKLQLTPAEDGQEATDAETKNFNAEVDFWNALASDVGGYGPSDEKKPDDWKELVPDRDKEEAVKLLLAAETIAAQVVKKAKFRAWGKNRSNAVQVRCYFAGHLLITTHNFREATAADRAEWKSLTSKLRLKQGANPSQSATEIPAQMAAKAKLYNSMVTSFTGYVGQPPLHHKALAVQRHFALTAKVLEKN
jgi:hypothetical protein